MKLSYQFALILMVIGSFFMPERCVFAGSQPGPIVLSFIYDNVESLSQTNLLAVASSLNKPWAIVDLKPDATSGRLKIPHIVPNGTPSIDLGDNLVYVSGSYYVRHQLGLNVSDRGSYRWSIPFIAEAPEQIKLMAESNPFRVNSTESRTILCQIHENFTDEQRFSNVHIVPEGWEDSVSEATEFFKGHPAVVASNLDLRSLLNNQNPYIALTASQVLTQNHQFATTEMESVLSRSNATLLGAVIVVARTSQWMTQHDNGVWLKQRINSITSLNQLEGIAVGIVAAQQIISGNTQYPVPATVALEKTSDYKGYQASVSKEQDYELSLMILIRHKLHELDPGGTSSDAQWLAIDSACRLYGV